jgi:hypothetical protein
MEAAMNLHIVDNTCRISLIAVGLIGSLSAHADVPYEYKGQPVFLGEAEIGSGSYVQTLPGFLQAPTITPPPPIIIGSPISATFSFASPLAANSTIPLHLESGGYNFLEATQGGLTGYSTDILTSTNYRITNNIDAYLAGSAGDTFDYYRYSALDGQVTTDASGNISAWDLQFTLYDDGDGTGIRIDKTTNEFTNWSGGGFGFQPDAILNISSSPASSQSIDNVVELDEAPYSGPDPYTFSGSDWSQANPGGEQHFRYYTAEPGSIVLVPEPETWAMMLVGLSLLGWRARGKEITSVNRT